MSKRYSTNLLNSSSGMFQLVSAPPPLVEDELRIFLTLFMHGQFLGNLYSWSTPEHTRWKYTRTLGSVHTEFRLVDSSVTKAVFL